MAFGDTDPQVSNFDALIAGDVSVAAAEPTAEPSPAAITAPSSSPGQPVAPPVTEPAAQPVAPPVPAPDITQEYIATLKGQVAQLLQVTQEQALQQRALMDQQLKESAPALTAEQRQAKIAGAFEALNNDPEAYIQSLVDAKIAATKKDFADQYSVRDPEVEAQREIGRSLDGLWKNPEGKEIRPELAKKEFRELMVSGPVASAVYQKLYAGQDPRIVARNPQFMVELYHEARAQASAKFAPTQTQAASDAAAQTAIAAAHGTPPATGIIPAGSPAPQDPDAKFKQEMMSATSPTDMLLKLMATPKK